MHPEYIDKNIAVVAEEDSEILGYFSIIEENPKRKFRVGSYEVSGGFFLEMSKSEK